MKRIKSVLSLVRLFGVTAVALAIVVSMAGLSFTGCNNPASGKTPSVDDSDTITINIPNLPTPDEDDYYIDNLTQEAGNISPVKIKAKMGKSTGKITIYYEGTSDTIYDKSTTLPMTAGSYTVTFDVKAVIGWNAASGLSAGTLVITGITEEGTVTISILDITDIVSGITIYIPVLHRVSGESTATLTFTDADAAQYDANNISWRVDGTEIGTGFSVILDAANPASAYKALGKHYLTVSVKKDGMLYSKTIPFTVAY